MNEQQFVQQVHLLNKQHVKGSRKIGEHTSEPICLRCAQRWPCTPRILAGICLARLYLAAKEESNAE